jgi:hypothetical protein
LTVIMMMISRKPSSTLVSCANRPDATWCTMRRCILRQCVSPCCSAHCRVLAKA